VGGMRCDEPTDGTRPCLTDEGPARLLRRALEPVGCLEPGDSALPRLRGELASFETIAKFLGEHYGDIRIPRLQASIRSSRSSKDSWAPRRRATSCCAKSTQRPGDSGSSSCCSLRPIRPLPSAGAARLPPSSPRLADVVLFSSSACASLRFSARFAFLRSSSSTTCRPCQESQTSRTKHVSGSGCSCPRTVARLLVTKRCCIEYRGRR
jgi:hypothetical protein